jgi:hypothetical protein
MQRRLTDDERSAVSVVMFWQRKLEEGGITASGQEVYEQMLAHNTTDGRPYVEPPLTDEDARQRPWVMVRDDETAPWHGPVVFVDKLPNGRYVCRTRCQKGVNAWFDCRRATAEEIAAAGLEVAE